NLGGAAAAAAAGAETYFWTHLRLQHDLAALWAKVVTDVGSVPSVLGYDLFNEPPAGLVPPEVFESTVLPRFYRILGRAIRKVQPRSLLFVEPAWLHSAATPASFFLGPVGLHRIVYAPHEYGSSLNDASGNVADAGGPGQFEPDLALSEEQAKLLHAPLWIGEWGDVDTSSPIGISARSYVPDMVTAQDRFMVGSAYWTWTSGSWPYTPGVQAALSRITPLAVAGMPRRFVTGEHSLSFTWIASSGKTIVSLPYGMLPRVHVLAGHVHARLIGAGSLALSARPGQLASVDITAASGE
ncbi:MAG: glycoside hydrolase family 5 protein, partial [Acidimicrobiales bacterium]